MAAREAACRGARSTCEEAAKLATPTSHHFGGPPPCPSPTTPGVHRPVHLPPLRGSTALSTSHHSWGPPPCPPPTTPKVHRPVHLPPLRGSTALCPLLRAPACQPLCLPSLPCQGATGVVGLGFAVPLCEHPSSMHVARGSLQVRDACQASHLPSPTYRRRWASLTWLCSGFPPPSSAPCMRPPPP